jgi:hypothetical protein
MDENHKIAIKEIQVFRFNEGKKNFQLEAQCNFKLEQTSPEFVFNNSDIKQLLMFTNLGLITFDYFRGEVVGNPLYNFKNHLDGAPKFGKMSIDQKKFVVASVEEAYYIDMKLRIEIDLDLQEKVRDIENVTCDHGNFYVLCNKKEDKLGLYCFIINTEDPTKPANYLLNWQNKMKISDVDLAFMDDTVVNEEGENFKKSYLILSYKTIGINTFNCLVINLGTKLIEFWHESNQLWEAPVKGFLLSTNDFMILNKDGINVIALGEKDKKTLTDNEGNKRVLHSLGSCNYLKIEPENHLMFQCQFYEKRTICVQHQYLDTIGNTKFDDIYKIRIKDFTLRELAVIQSIYSCKSPSEMEKLVTE